MKITYKQPLLIFILSIIFILPLKAQDKQTELLFNAIKMNNTTVIKAILNKNPGFIDSTLTEKFIFRGITKNPLHQALLYSNKSTIDLLLTFKADPSVDLFESGFMTSKSISCLEILVINRDLNLIKYLFDKLNVSAKSFCNALFEAYDGSKDEVVKYLLTKGEDVLLSSKKMNSTKQ